MPNRFQSLSLALALSLGGCSPRAATAPAPARAPDPAGFSGERALDSVRSFLAVGPRAANTPGAARAAEYLRARLGEAGVAAAVDRFEDAIRDGTGVFYNVTARIPGSSGRTVVIGCHFDTKTGLGEPFDGANDSGSGVGVLLELARVLKAAGGARDEVVLAFLDGEESVREYSARDGLHGSRRLARALTAPGAGATNVRAVIILDMIGDRDLTVTIPANSTPYLASKVFEAARQEGVRDRFSLLRMEMIDDHEPFFNAGLPAIDLIDFQYGSAPGKNDYWHTSADTIDKLSAASLQAVGRVVIRVLNSLEPASGAPVPGRPALH